MINMDFFSSLIFILNFYLFFLVMITVFVLFILFYSWFTSFFFFSQFLFLEFYWTILPCVLMLFFFLPLFIVLNFELAYEVVFLSSNQWFWSSFVDSVFYSNDFFLFILSLSFFSTCSYLFLLTSSDVLHSLFFPKFFLKMDSVPGCIHEYFLPLMSCGIFQGTCAELCGVNHSSMPLILVVY